jgi:hypothetical protein
LEFQVTFVNVLLHGVVLYHRTLFGGAYTAEQRSAVPRGKKITT